MNRDNQHTEPLEGDNNASLRNTANPNKHFIIMKSRVLYMLFFILALSSLSMILWYQFGSNSERYKEQAKNYSFKNVLIEAPRGDILSDDGRTLRTSLVLYELRMDFMAPGLDNKKFNDNVEALAQRLSEFFNDKSSSSYHRELLTARSKKRRYHRLSLRKVNYLELQQIKKFPLLNESPNQGGFIVIPIGIRVNSYGDLASRSLGFVNSVGVKVGLEGAFDDYLKGKNGLTVKQKITGNFWIPVDSKNNIEPVDGFNVVSTLNVEIQDVVQRVLLAQVSKEDADWGAAVVMDVESGHIKAIANTTRKKSGEMIEDYNYAVGMSLEPGSTFKLAGLIALMDDKQVPITEHFDTEDGDANIGYVKVVDSRIGGYGEISLKEIIEKSSNIGIAKALTKYYEKEPSRFVDYLSKFQFDKSLNLQIKGEGKSFIKHPKKRNGWDGTTLTMMSYGYGLRLNLLQTLSLYNAVANQGRMIKPLFVSAIESDGKVIKHIETEVINNQICSPSTLIHIRNTLRGVVENGTARMLRNKNYSVEAKTGTAQIAFGTSGYTSASGGRNYLGSIVGYFPSEKPKYTILIAIKTSWEPGEKKNIYGGRLCGSVFKHIADYIYNSDFELQAKDSRLNKYATRVTKASKGNVVELKKLSRLLEIRTPIINEGDKRNIIVEGVNNNLAPNVINYAAMEAQQILWDRGYDVELRTRGNIRTQRTIKDENSTKELVVLN